MAALIPLLISVVAALLGIAAARRGWWTHAAITSVCALLALYTALLLAGTTLAGTTITTTEAPVWSPDTTTLVEADR